MNAIRPNSDLIKKLPKVDDRRFAKRSMKAVNDEIDKSAADRFGSKAKFIVADMMPVESTVRPLLYDGFTKEEKGRYQYLRVSEEYVLSHSTHKDLVVKTLPTAFARETLQSLGCSSLHNI